MADKVYEVVYYVVHPGEPKGRWEFAARYDEREQADAKAIDLRQAGYDARVMEEDA
jgi:hypothetical protein